MPPTFAWAQAVATVGRPEPLLPDLTPLRASALAIQHVRGGGRELRFAGTLANVGEGPLEGFAIACPRHGAKFDIRDGRALTMPATRATVVHEVKVVGDDVLIKLCD
jgi:hypothetical protein